MSQPFKPARPGFYYANEGNQENLVCLCPCGCNGENTPGDGFPVNPQTNRCLCCAEMSSHEVSPFNRDLIEQITELRQVADYLEHMLNARKQRLFRSNSHSTLTR